MTSLTTTEFLTLFYIFAAEFIFQFVLVGDVPASSVQKDGSPILHCQEQISPWQSVQKKDYFLSGHYPGDYYDLSFISLNDD